MEPMVIGPGGKGPEQIMALYVMSLMTMGRGISEEGPSKELILAEMSKDLDKIFDHYEKARAEVATEIIDAEIVGE